MLNISAGGAREAALTACELRMPTHPPDRSKTIKRGPGRADVARAPTSPPPGRPEARGGEQRPGLPAQRPTPLRCR